MSKSGKRVFGSTVEVTRAYGIFLYFKFST